MGLWIDTDMGVDDLFAVLLAVKHAPVDGMSLSFGCATLEQVAANASAAKGLFGWPFPVTTGAERAILGGLETAERILGKTGMPTRGATLPPAGPAVYPPAIPALAHWLQGQQSAQILALGPLTNLATLALAHPDLIPNIGRITWMGGAIGAGNHTASAEFNAFADPEALAILLARDVPLTMVDLDICRQVQITEGDVRAIAHPLLRDLLGGYLDIALNRGRASMALYDPVAAAALLRPDLFVARAARVEVELTGQHTRGRTVVDLRHPPNDHVQVLTGCDSAVVRGLCLGGLVA